MRAEGKRYLLWSVYGKKNWEVIDTINGARHPL